MNKRLSKRWNLFNLSITILVFDSLWRYSYTRTIYAKPIFAYVSVLLLFALFLHIAIKYNWGAWSNLCKAWAPYILLTFFGYALTPAILAPYWIICLILLLVAQKISILPHVPFKLLFGGGIFALTGIFVQMFFPSFYDARITSLFINDEDIELWMEEYGFNGFTSQVALNATFLVYAEAALLCMKEKILHQKLQSPILYYTLLTLVVIGVFLTGKRLLAAIALAMPFLVYFFSKKFSTNKVLTIFFVALLAYFAFDYFVNNLSNYSDSLLLRRFVSSYIEANAGNDITSKRTYLYQLAWNAFDSSPIFGIGVGKFKAVTGATMAVHNTYLQVLCEQGIFGFMLFFPPIVYSFIYTTRLISKINDENLLSYLKLSLAFQLIYIIYSLTGNENIGAGYIMYFIGIAIVISVEKEIRDYKLLKKMV